MKRLLLILICFISLAAVAQDTTWNKTAAKMYGTKAEKVHQDNIENQSQSRYLVRLIGFKQYYLNEIGTFIQSNMGFSMDDNSPERKGFYIDTYTKNGVFIGKNKPGKLVLTFAVDKSERIKYGTINGRFGDLANLFLNYWPQDAEWAMIDQLKPGVVAQKHSFGDLITFNWSGTVPYIKVTKDPNISFPVPPLNAAN